MKKNIASGISCIHGFNHGLLRKFMQLFLLVGMMILAPLAAAADERFIIGVRGSVTPDDISGEDFNRYEIGLGYALPWRWQWPSWQLSTWLNGSAGVLEGGNNTAFIGTIGPGVMVSWDDWPVTVDIGVSPTYISRDHFDNADIGGNFHFTSHIAIRAWFAQRFALGYRFEHASNSSLESTNPGVDSHMLELSYRF